MKTQLDLFKRIRRWDEKNYKYPGDAIQAAAIAMEAVLCSKPRRRAAVRATSSEAFRSLKAESVSRVQAAILAALRRLGPSTDENIYRALLRREIIVTPSGLRTRRSELVKLGRVKAAGTTTNSRGRTVTLWSLA